MIGCIIYQTFLSYIGGTNYVLNAPRSNIVHANKEGLVGSFGYFLIFSFSVSIGQFLFSNVNINSQKSLTNNHNFNKTNCSSIKSEDHRKRTQNNFLSVNNKLYIIIVLLILSIGSWIVWWLLNEYIQETSRRLVNVTYIAWSIGLNTTIVTFYFFIEYLLQNSSSVCMLEQIINQYQLPIFLGANLMTGLVNLTTNTLIASNTEAFCILTIYIFIVTFVPTIFYHLKLLSNKKNI